MRKNKKKSTQIRNPLATLRADGFGDGAGVAQAVGVDSTHDEQVDGVGEQARDGVRLHLHVVRHGLPGAAC